MEHKLLKIILIIIMLIMGGFVIGYVLSSVFTAIYNDTYTKGLQSQGHDLEVINYLSDNPRDSIKYQKQ